MFKGHFYQLKPGWWIVSDTHFGHKKIIQYSRPEFEEWEDDPEKLGEQRITNEAVRKMHASMIKEWNETIKPEDKVIHLGDVALGVKKSKLKQIITSLNGTKMLLPGNHDRGLIKKDRHYFNDVGFKNVEVGVTQIEIEDEDGHVIILSHEPIEHIPFAGGLGIGHITNIHGHVHGGMTEELYAMDSRRINVCWDATKKGGK